MCGVIGEIFITLIYSGKGAILFLDFTKAFDSLEWSFMTECLDKFCFKSSFIRWIRTMYTDIKGCILNNGWVSAPFKV
jgi:hypothetical protein